MSENNSVDPPSDESTVNTQPVDEEISWGDVAGDMEKQKELLHTEADAKKAAQEAAQTAAPAPASGAGSEKDKADIDFILDIPLTVTVELGRARMVINDLLQLGQGSVIELAKLVGEPLEVFVNSKLVARGEVVVVNDKFGVRLTDIVSPMDRVDRLS